MKFSSLATTSAWQPSVTSSQPDQRRVADRLRDVVVDPPARRDGGSGVLHLFQPPWLFRSTWPEAENRTCGTQATQSNPTHADHRRGQAGSGQGRNPHGPGSRTAWGRRCSPFRHVTAPCTMGPIGGTVTRMLPGDDATMSRSSRFTTLNGSRRPTAMIFVGVLAGLAALGLAVPDRALGQLGGGGDGRPVRGTGLSPQFKIEASRSPIRSSSATPTDGPRSRSSSTRLRRTPRSSTPRPCPRAEGSAHGFGGG